MVIEGKERKVATDAQFLIYYDRRMTLIYLKLKKKKKNERGMGIYSKGSRFGWLFWPYEPLLVDDVTTPSCNKKHFS